MRVCVCVCVCAITLIILVGILFLTFFIASLVSFVLSEMAGEACQHFTLVYDISHAHKQIAVEDSEWVRLACHVGGTAAATLRDQLPALRDKGDDSAQIGPTRVAFSDSQLAEEIWVNQVGTFGVGSAGYWWGRAGALLVRLSHYYATSTVGALWVLLYADDVKATAGGPRFELPLLNHLFLLKVLGTPMKWRKVRGGVPVAPTPRPVKKRQSG